MCVCVIERDKVRKRGGERERREEQEKERISELTVAKTLGLTYTSPAPIPEEKVTYPRSPNSFTEGGIDAMSLALG